MAEVQKSTNAGESTARFIEFVMMQAQNASLFLGLMPNPNTNQPEVNLDLARMFIDQLAMIQEKTRGNLSSEESNVLRNALTNLQMAFFEVAKGGGASPAASAEEEPEPEFAPETEPAARAEAPVPPAAEPPAEGGGESKKRFSKSYGS
jgi:hypothetical protein